MNAMHAVLRAAVRWRRNMLETKALLAELEPCDEGPHGDVPCWKFDFTGDEPLPISRRCPPCQRNATNTVPALRAARARRGGLTSALARAVDRLIAEAEEEA